MIRNEEVFTQMDPFIEPGEINEGPELVEKSGYIPAEEQIGAMLRAGERLGEFRREAYDFGDKEDIPDDYVDPTRSPGFDLADASALQRDIAARIATKQADKVEDKPQQVEPEKEPVKDESVT